jgi:DNA-binding NtrC family response regulator
MATILCISDDIRSLEAQSALLKEKGYEVLIASDRATAIEMTQNHSVDVVVLDFSIIGWNGNRILDLLMDEQPNLPIAIVSGSLDCIPEPLRWYADELLQKSDGAEVFFSVVEKLVNISKAKKFLGKQRARRIEQVA